MNQETSDHHAHSPIIAGPPWPAKPGARAILEALSAAEFSCVSRTEGVCFVQISNAFTQLTGYSESQVLGANLEILYGSATDPATVRSIKMALANRHSFRGELVCYRSDGQPVWCLVVLAPLYEESNGEGYLTGALLDVSERKIEEDHLKAKELTYRGIFTNAVEGIYQSTPDGNYLEVNPALARMYGYESPEELLSKVRDIQEQIYVDPGMREKFKTEIEKSDVVHGLEYQVRRHDGRVIWISENARVVRDEHGRIRYYEGFIEEITQRKEAEAALRRSQQQLIETSRQVGMAEVAAGVLHNMGNALNSINVSASVLSERVRGSKVNGVAKAAVLLEANAPDLARYISTDPKGQQLPKYLSRLGQHLLSEQAALQDELARLRKGLEHIGAIVAMQQNYAKASSEAEKVDPIELVEDALRMSAGSLARHEVEVIRQYAPDLPIVTVAKHAVLQILINLIGNAKKACEAPGLHPKLVTLRVGTSHEGKFVRMEVVDNGVGIPEANLTRIFNHGFTTRKDGHGFGLHSGATLAKQLGGSLNALSAGPGKGAAFILEFPINPEQNGRK